MRIWNFLKYHLKSYQKIKYLDLNLSKHVQDLYAESYRGWLEKSRKIYINGEVCHVHPWKPQYCQDTNSSQIDL